MKNIIDTPHMHCVAIYAPYWRHLFYIKHKEVSNYDSNGANGYDYSCDVRGIQGYFFRN